MSYRKHSRRPWKEELKDILDVHASERRGIAVLLLLCFLAAGWVLYEQRIAPDVVRDRADFEVVARESIAQGSSGSVDQRSDLQGIDAAVVLFNFDPNGLPMEQWTALGLSERQAAAILRYEERGGRFRTKADLARMRVVDPELFARWEPFILLPDSIEISAVGERWRFAEPGRWRDTSARHFPGSPERPERVVVEVNTADSSRLVQVRGIGPAFARSIVRYRDRLGGFHSLDQLADVPILRDKPDAVAELKGRLLLDTLMVRRLPINTMSVEDLGRHPCAGWKVAKALVAYRQHHGPFRTVADIKGCVLITDSVYRKLAPYLTLE